MTVYSFQYYAVATGTILFYDYLLTLNDEVRRDSSSESCDRLLKPRFVADQVHMVRQEIVECVYHLKRTMYSADFLAAFWLFVAVSWFIRFEIASPSEGAYRIGTFR